MLRTDYKNDAFSGDRKYNMVNNSDGTVSLQDVTEYSVEGDVFGAKDINDTNTRVNELTEGLNSLTIQYTVSDTSKTFEENLQTLIDYCVSVGGLQKKYMASGVIAWKDFASHYLFSFYISIDGYIAGTIELSNISKSYSVYRKGGGASIEVSPFKSGSKSARITVVSNIQTLVEGDLVLFNGRQYCTGFTLSGFTILANSTQVVLARRNSDATCSVSTNVSGYDIFKIEVDWNGTSVTTGGYSLSNIEKGKYIIFTGFASQPHSALVLNRSSNVSIISSENTVAIPICIGYVDENQGEISLYYSWGSEYWNTNNTNYVRSFILN